MTTRISLEGGTLEGFPVMWAALHRVLALDQCQVHQSQQSDVIHHNGKENNVTYHHMSHYEQESKTKEKIAEE